MKRKVILLNVILLALLAWLGWSARNRWTASEQHEEEVLATQAAPVEEVPPPPVPKVAPVRPVDYIDVAQQTLFSKDRDPNVVIEVKAPPPPPPEPDPPAFPSYYGQMAFNEPVILFGVDGAQKSFKIGDEIGELTIKDFDRDNVTFGWDGKDLTAKLSELRPKDDEPAQNTASRSTTAKTAKSAPAPTVRSMGDSEGLKPAAKGEPEIGREAGAGRTCVPGDNSPSGTISQGYRKVVSQTLFGSECHWVRVQ